MNPDRKMNCAVLYPSACTLGESPVWHPQRQSCFWTDIDGKKIYEYLWADQCVLSHAFQQRVSLIVPGAGRDLVLGLQGGVARFDPDTGHLSALADLGADWQSHRCNDGACDREGRLWIGTMELDGKQGAGAVYCVQKNKPVEIKIESVSISNGLAWSADQTRMYYTDSLTREIWCYRYDVRTANISFEKIVTRVQRSAGLPDGMAMDEDGMLWVALWGGSSVGRLNTFTGKFVEFINVPAPHVTSCAFVGENLDQLLITTARKELNDEQLASYPQSGHVFIARPGVRGLPKFSCSL